MVHLHTDVAGRTGTVEDRHLSVLRTKQRLGGLLSAHAKMHARDARQSRDTSLEVLLLALQLQLEVALQRLVAEGGDKDGLRHRVGSGGDGIGKLVDVAEETSLKQGLDNGSSIELRGILHTKFGILLLGVGLHRDAEHLAAITTHNSRHSSADWGRKAHLRETLVDKQCVARTDMVALLDGHLRRHTNEIVGHERVLCRRLQAGNGLCGTSFQTDVQALT